MPVPPSTALRMDSLRDPLQPYTSLDARPCKTALVGRPLKVHIRALRPATALGEEPRPRRSSPQHEIGTVAVLPVQHGQKSHDA